MEAATDYLARLPQLSDAEVDEAAELFGARLPTADPASRRDALRGVLMQGGRPTEQPRATGPRPQRSTVNALMTGRDPGFPSRGAEAGNLLPEVDNLSESERRAVAERHGVASSDPNALRTELMYRYLRERMRADTGQ
jgi:hypothetical protein